MHGSDTDVSANGDTLHLDDFNLKEEVTSCIAESIGLIQPPSVGDELLESPPFPQAIPKAVCFAHLVGNGQPCAPDKYVKHA